jgi:hypothetical protein
VSSSSGRMSCSIVRSYLEMTWVRVLILSDSVCQYPIWSRSSVVSVRHPYPFGMRVLFMKQSATHACLEHAIDNREHVCFSIAEAEWLQ